MQTIEALLRRIRVNAHSSVRLETAGKVVWIDPFSLTEAPGDADVIFLTHEHFDHCSPEDIARVWKKETLFVLPGTMAAKAAGTTKGHRVIPVRPGDRGEADGVPFEAVRAYNPAKPFHPKERDWVGYILTAEGLRVYVAGDTDATPEAAAVRCDVAMLPIGGKYTMNPAEAAALANRIRPQAVIPIHYGSVAGSLRDFDRFAAAVDPEIRVVRVI